MTNKKVPINSILELIDKSYKNNEINDNEYVDMLSQFLLYQNIVDFSIEIEDKISYDKLSINDLLYLFVQLKLIDKSITYDNMANIAHYIWHFDYNDNKDKVLEKIHDLFL